MSFDAKKKETIDSIFHAQGYTDYRWIDPKQIVVAQWVRLKCMFGCGGYGKIACCPPNLPSVTECERFFQEYNQAMIFRFAKKFDNPDDRHAWSRKVNLKLLKLEREVFFSGYEKVFLLFMIFFLPK